MPAVDITRSASFYTEVFRWSMRHRLSRNPMYIGVIDVLLGYALAVEIAVHLRALVSEEPWARRTFGADYRARVPRWLL